MNKVILLGNLTKDPEVKAYANGSLTIVNVAVSDGWGDKKKTYFISGLASGRTGENIAKYFQKGKQILLEGKLYTKKNDDTGYEELKLQVYGFSFINDGSKSSAKKEAPAEAPELDDIPF